ncbi:DUF5691 domain-containing protein [Streptomyces winkii]|uniref:DUF5691 domain-containing protein n=1 Tax=Streptomyces winkii TaxID=3051178 RepID=UPI0028D88958|nr:DUF5691 domain-containing protein [Streptomyces sp. DSM 40971]
MTAASLLTDDQGAASATWGELVTAALLGSTRRTPPGGTPAALLDAAAVETVRHRAGLLPAPAAARLAPAPEDSRPPLPAAAARRLTLLLAGRSGGAGAGGGRRGTTPDLAELLPQWLAAANEYGYRAPDAQLPDLLDAARARTDLRAETLEFAGPRALWLARLNPEWKFALRNGQPRQRAAGAAEQPAAAQPGFAPEAARRLWDEGLFSERVALLASLRRRDPAAGIALLAGTWSAERAEDRLMFLDSLRESLRPSDEEFLEQALSDRSRTVRATAAELLGTLPGSAFAARMAARARTYVTQDPLSTTPRIAVEAPHECDADMQRDGVAPKPPAGRGERAWWLGQLVEAAPLSAWREQFGGRGAREIVALPVADDWREDLHGAWCRAAVRQRDVEWARALVGHPTAPPAEGPGDAARLLAVLPEEERAAWAAGFIEAHGLSDAFRLLGVCAVPWSERLGRAVVDALEIARDAGSYPWSFSGVLGLAERCLAPVDAARLEPLAAVPDEPEGGSPGAGAYWAEAFQRLVATLRLRAEIRAELSGEAERAGEAERTREQTPSGDRTDRGESEHGPSGQ